MPHEAEKTAMGWPVEPDGLTEILVRIKDDYTDLPIYVTENGRAVNDYIDPEGDVDDDERVSTLTTTSGQPTRRSSRASTCAVTWCGPSWTISSGPKDTPNGSG